MKTSLRLADYLGHILQAIKRIERHVSDVDEIRFLESELVQDAVIRNIEIIGEAANTIWRTYPEFAAAHSEIPWEAMYTMRAPTDAMTPWSTSVTKAASSTRVCCGVGRRPRICR